uniref:AIP3 domain-containing protein n=1 Tax=Syphacia muris TaxID=451379 RepID=A0A0N5AUP5_9BILA
MLQKIKTALKVHVIGITAARLSSTFQVKTAPLAVEEDIRDQRQSTLPKPPSGRASAVLQHLREDARPHPVTVIRDSHSPTPLRVERPTTSPCVVFLEVNDEVKRAILPPVVDTIDSVKALFLRTFPQLTAKYLNLPYVKIYIQEPSKGQLFYELDDLKDLKDRAVLKLREQLSGFQSPQPIRFTDHPPDYLSESEGELSDYRSRTPHRIGSYRPPSSLDKRSYGSLKSARSPIPPRFDSYYDPYSSDASSQEPRSGSATPVIDKETRFRMETMERQLAGLSSLVHSALVSKGMSETSQRDMQELRKQILALHSDCDDVKEFKKNGLVSAHPGSSIPSSTEPSLPDTYSLNGEAQQHLIRLKQQTADIQNQLRQVRRAVQVNVQNGRDILRDAFDQIQKHISKQAGIDAMTIKPDHIESLKSEHITQITQLQKSLQSFEEDVEDVRKLVLNTNRKLRMSEVEHFTNSLTKIGRNAARLKTQFPSIQSELEKKIKADMERVVREESFIKEESTQIDQCLRRCKTLANMMVTMKKLAMVQDPAVTSPYRIERSADRMSVKSGNGTIATTREDLSKQSPNESVSVPAMPTSGLVLVGQNLGSRASAPPSGRTIKDSNLPPPVPPSPHNYEKPSTSDKYEETRMLDAILDELNSTRKLSLNGPPKPPERKSSSDLKSRFTPNEVKNIQHQQKGASTPIINTALRSPASYNQPHLSSARPPPPFYVPNNNSRSSLNYRPPSLPPVQHRTTLKYAESFPEHFQRPPEAIASTDALDPNESLRANGASSNESLNSQEGISIIQK